MQFRLGLTATVVAAVFGCLCSSAFAVTPGWECVPTTAGQAVTSGGTGSSPSCGSASTPVLAPTFVSNGVGGKSTVQFSGVNLQLVNGSGSETTLNGEGNLVIGYDPSPGAQTGSHNLVLGTNQQSDTSYGGIDAGEQNTISAATASVLGGSSNDASDIDATVSGGSGNHSYGFASSITGGFANYAGGNYSSVSGGEANTAADLFSMVAGGCHNIAGSAGVQSVPCNSTGIETVSGGTADQASGLASWAGGGNANVASGYQATALGGYGNQAQPNSNGANMTVVGGNTNVAKGDTSTVTGGFYNTTSGRGSSISGGQSNTASGAQSSVSGGLLNLASAPEASILGGEGNDVTSNCGTFPYTGQSC
jgi:hypothetical protein